MPSVPRPMYVISDGINAVPTNVSASLMSSHVILSILYFSPLLKVDSLHYSLFSNLIFMSTSIFELKNYLF